MPLRRGGTLHEPGGSCGNFRADRVRAGISVISDIAQCVRTAQGICSSHWTKAAKLELWTLRPERTTRFSISCMREELFPWPEVAFPALHTGSNAKPRDPG